MSELRAKIDANYLVRDTHAAELSKSAGLSQEDRTTISDRAAEYVSNIRDGSDPGLMEVFLAEYGLSTDEGIALMCLAEAFLRVPDADTIDALIEDKIAPSDWGTHLGQSSSSLVNASTWALMITGRLLDDDHPGIARTLRGAVKRLGEPVIRVAVDRAMREMGRQFVLGENITDAMARGAGMEKRGFTYSFDMLGEAACTDADAKAFHLAYSRAISAIAEGCVSGNVTKNPGISVKLSALHSRFEYAQKARVMEELVPRLRSLALLAKSAGMGFNIDAEEADRLSLSLDVIEAVVSEPALKGWDGFGIVVQAYAPRAPFVIDWFYNLAERLDRRFMLRLVKGAYWDAEIKRAQVLGLQGFPVFTTKAVTDVSYLANARQLLNMTDRIYPQFATHNAHTVAGILHMADNLPRDTFEFQRLHGMGEALHTMVLQGEGTRCRIYAPVGEHEDLLAYLVRRLLENGANSSFVNQIVDEAVPPETVAADPFDKLEGTSDLPTGRQIFLPLRKNSKGWDITHEPTLKHIFDQRDLFRGHQWTASPILLNKHPDAGGEPAEIRNPALPKDVVGTARHATTTEVKTAFDSAANWDASAADRAKILRDVAQLFETNAPELFAILQREAGKTLQDAEGEVREAVDFLHYYAAEAESGEHRPRGIWACISPWNFPLAIFTGQIAAALAVGNAVLAKPAQQTPLIAYRAVELMLKAGVPRDVLQLLPGDASVGSVLTSDARLGGVAFTGSTATARIICAAMADNCSPGTPLIAETGGLNAMLVDSTALPEHAVRDIVASAFQSAGQRCSALRVLYVQKDVADATIEMLAGAMDELSLGDPWELVSDIGPIIDGDAKAKIAAHIAAARAEGRLMQECAGPTPGNFVAPTMIRIDGIAQLDEEIFGPVLHVATFESGDLENVLRDINNTGYGLTFGLHTRIDERVQRVVETVTAGNIYVNRNQIGAVVGSQPFGGEGLSGTGPKAGGPHYLARFAIPSDSAKSEVDRTPRANGDQIKPIPIDLPGPTGESNRLRFFRKNPILCLGPDTKMVADQCNAVTALGGVAIPSTGLADRPAMEQINDPDIGGVLWWGDATTGRAIAQALSKRAGPIVPLIVAQPDVVHIMHERHVCVDTTAAGGNAALLAEMG